MRAWTTSRYTPQESTYRRLWRSNHYKDDGLPLQVFIKLSQQPCHYCGAPPSQRYNGYGPNYRAHCGYGKLKRVTKKRYDAAWVLYNGIDRIDSSLDHSCIENLVSCCWTCNRAKQTLTPEQFYQWAERVVLYHISKEIKELGT